MQEMPCAFALALVKAGSNIAARMAMIAITTRSSIKVKPGAFFGVLVVLVVSLRIHVQLGLELELFSLMGGYGSSKPKERWVGAEPSLAVLLP